VSSPSGSSNCTYPAAGTPPCAGGPGAWGAGSPPSAGGSRGVVPPGKQRKPVSPVAAERAARKELLRLERQIERASVRETALNSELAANATDYEKLTELGAQLRVVQAEKAELEERWLEVASALEA
jgi:ABC transport system ATP-binding/permease protein